MRSKMRSEGPMVLLVVHVSINGNFATGGDVAGRDELTITVQFRCGSRCETLRESQPRASNTTAALGQRRQTTHGPFGTHSSTLRAAMEARARSFVNLQSVRHAGLRTERATRRARLAAPRGEGVGTADRRVAHFRRCKRQRQHR